MIIILCLFPLEGSYLRAQPPSSKVFEIDRINLGLAKGLLGSSAPFSRLELHNQDGSLRSTTAHDVLLAQKIASQLRSEFQKSLSFSPAAVSLWATDLIAVAEKIESAGGYANLTLGSAIRWVAMDSLFFAFLSGGAPSKETLDALGRAYQNYLQIDTLQDDCDYSGLDSEQVNALKNTADKYEKAGRHIVFFGYGSVNTKLAGRSANMLNFDPLSQSLKVKSIQKLFLSMSAMSTIATNGLYPLGLAISRGGNPKELLLNEKEWLRVLGSLKIELPQPAGEIKSSHVSGALLTLKSEFFFKKGSRCASNGCAAALQ